MSEHQQPTDRDAAFQRQRTEVAAALARQPASFWSASLAALGIIIGAVGPWATAYGFVSLSGTGMHGWRSVAVGAWALAMLAVYQLRSARLPLILAGAGGALSAIQAVASLAKINSNGAVTVLGQQYRYLSPAWGLYLLLAAAIALVVSVSALTWRASRAAG